MIVYVLIALLRMAVYIILQTTVSSKGAIYGTLQQYCSALCSVYRTLYRTSKRLREGAMTPSYPLCRKASQRPNIKKKIKKDFRFASLT